MADIASVLALSVDALRDELSAKGLETTGSKTVLQARLLAAMGVAGPNQQENGGGQQGNQAGAGRKERKYWIEKAKELATILQPIGSLDYWEGYKEKMLAALIQVTYDSSEGAVSLTDFDSWCDGSKSDVHGLETCSDDMNALLHTAVRKIIKTSEPNQQSMLSNLVEVTRDECTPDEYSKLTKRMGVVGLRRIDRYAAQIKTFTESRLKDRLEEMNYTVGGTVPISKYLSDYGKVAKAYYGDAFARKTESILQTLCKSIYGAGFEANNLAIMIKLRYPGTLEGNKLTYTTITNYLTELFSNTTRKKEVALKATDGKGGGGGSKRGGNEQQGTNTYKKRRVLDNTKNNGDKTSR